MAGCRVGLRQPGEGVDVGQLLTTIAVVPKGFRIERDYLFLADEFIDKRVRSLV